MRIGVACGGTGGHVYPGLAAAEALARRGHAVTVWLAGKGIEGESAAGWKGETVIVPAAGLAGPPSLAWLGAARAMLAAAATCRRRMAGARPDALLAMGSYSSVGPALGARSLGVPLVLHEANAVPGRAVAFLARFAADVALSFEDAAALLPRARKTTLTGLPLKAGLDRRFEAGVLREGLFTVLVTGGSQGAHALNEICTEALCRLRREGVPVQAVHLSGARDERAVRDAYVAAGVPHAVFPFLREIGKAYNAADVAVTRAGAATCAELSACGVPALLVPLAAAVRGHQRANAEALARRGAAAIMPERDLSAERVADWVREGWRDRGLLASMRVKMREGARPDAAERVADAVERAARARRPAQAGAANAS